MAHFEDLCLEILKWMKAQKSTPWIFLSGDLGSGKTTLTGELLTHLGFPSKEVQSPTFLKVIAYSHAGESILHMDAYRVEEPTEFLKMGLEDYTDIKLGIVEWPEQFEKFLSAYPAFKESLDVRSILRIDLNSDHSVKSFQG